jgi:glycine betaine catabolism B
VSGFLHSQMPETLTSAESIRGRVVAVIVETEDTTTLRVRLDQPVELMAGQYFNLSSRVVGRPRPIIRTYSVASSPFPSSTVIDLTIKETPGGLVSPILVRGTPIGATVDLEGPFGYFTWDENDAGPLLLVAAGSGIVPLMSILRYQEARQLTVPTSLLYSSRDRKHVIFGADLERMKQRHSWLNVVHALTMDDRDRSADYHRHVDLLMLEAVAGELPESLLAYVCGPPPFVKGVETMLIAIGVRSTRINIEDWE